MTLDIFNRHPEKIAMANCAQLINCLNSLYLAHEDRFVVTPVGYVFEMYAPHQGSQAVRTIFSSPSVHYDRDGTPASFWGLKGSASVRNKDLMLTVVNPHVSDARETEIVVRGAAAESGNITTLTHSDIRAHNTFQQRQVVVPQSKALDVKGRVMVLRLPPASMTAVQIHLV
jgi:alpha-N-arabinofuranosidase